MINIVNKEECVGCYGCYSICNKNAISMENDIEGFKYPKIDKEKCNKCNLCSKVCPIIIEKEKENKPKAYACYNKDEVTRLESTSGGIFTLLSEEVINRNGIVFGASLNKDMEVFHEWIESVNEIKVFRGSKYVQSDIGNSYKKAKEYLIQNKLVLFSGTPCQISGLKRFLGKEYDNLICIDIICHGVPSPKVWKLYKDNISKGKKIENVKFRDKKLGWKNYSLSFKLEDSIEISNSCSKDSFIKGFVGNVYLRPSCYSCKFKGLNRESDITLGDFWGIENVKKEMDDSKGTSLIFVNSKKGSEILSKINDKIEKIEVDINESVKYNISAIKASYKNPMRKYFFKNIKAENFDKIVEKSLKEPLSIRIKTKIYNLKKSWV